MIIFFDIETVADEAAAEKFNIPAMQEKYKEHFNFMPEFNKILTITVGVKYKDGNKIENLPGTEKEQIEKFFEIINSEREENGKKIKNNPTLSGFNIKGFDLPFIIKRAIMYQVDIPEAVQAYYKKPREFTNILDLQEAYQHLGYRGGSLDVACNFLGITSPKDEGIDGSQVQKFYDEGKTAEILEYCKRDVEASIKLYNYFLEYKLI